MVPVPSSKTALITGLTGQVWTLQVNFICTFFEHWFLPKLWIFIWQNFLEENGIHEKIWKYKDKKSIITGSQNDLTRVSELRIQECGFISSYLISWHHRKWVTSRPSGLQWWIITGWIILGRAASWEGLSGPWHHQAGINLQHRKNPSPLWGPQGTGHSFALPWNIHG